MMTSTLHSDLSCRPSAILSNVSIAARDLSSFEDDQLVPTATQYEDLRHINRREMAQISDRIPKPADGFFNSETGHWQSNARDVEFDIAFAGISDDEDSVELQPRSAICTAVCGGTPYEDISDDDLVSDSNAIAKAIAKTKRDEAQLHTARGLLRIGSDSRVRALQESPPSSRAPSASLQRYARPIDSKLQAQASCAKEQTDLKVQSFLLSEQEKQYMRRCEVNHEVFVDPWLSKEVRARIRMSTPRGIQSQNPVAARSSAAARKRRAQAKAAAQAEAAAAAPQYDESAAGTGSTDEAAYAKGQRASSAPRRIGGQHYSSSSTGGHHSPEATEAPGTTRRSKASSSAKRGEGSPATMRGGKAEAGRSKSHQRRPRPKQSTSKAKSSGSSGAGIFRGSAAQTAAVPARKPRVPSHIVPPRRRSQGRRNSGPDTDNVPNSPASTKLHHGSSVASGQAATTGLATAGVGPSGSRQHQRQSVSRAMGPGSRAYLSTESSTEPNESGLDDIVHQPTHGTRAARRGATRRTAAAEQGAASGAQANPATRSVSTDAHHTTHGPTSHTRLNRVSSSPGSERLQRYRIRSSAGHPHHISSPRKGRASSTSHARSASTPDTRMRSHAPQGGQSTRASRPTPRPIPPAGAPAVSHERHSSDTRHVDPPRPPEQARAAAVEALRSLEQRVQTLTSKGLSKHAAGTAPHG